MGWQDRPYYRDRGDTSGGPLMWALNGSVPLFTAFGIHVRAHASLIVCMIFMLVLGLGRGFSWEDRVLGIAILFVVVLLHEFGHCFAARWVGGDANQIMMTPLGGLAMAGAPHRWLPTLITVAAGPAVNVVICAFCGIFLWIFHSFNFLPFVYPPLGTFSWLDPLRYLYLTYAISMSLLIFNLLPIYPLDGGQMLHAGLWWKFGHYRATLYACMVGLILGGILCVLSLAAGMFLTAVIFGSCVFNCFVIRKMTLANGPEEFADETDYSAAYEPATPKRHRRRLSQRAVKKARRVAMEARLEQERIDQILAKVSAQGIASLTWSERRSLRKATEHRRKRDLELSQ
jgi:stage IV sporulation protein FB